MYQGSPECLLSGQSLSTNADLGSTITSSVPLLELRRGMSHCCVPGKVFAFSSVPLQQTPLSGSVRQNSVRSVMSGTKPVRYSPSASGRVRLPAFVQSALQVLIDSRRGDFSLQSSLEAARRPLERVKGACQACLYASLDTPCNLHAGAQEALQPRRRLSIAFCVLDYPKGKMRHAECSMELLS